MISRMYGHMQPLRAVGYLLLAVAAVGVFVMPALWICLATLGGIAFHVLADMKDHQARTWPRLGRRRRERILSELDGSLGRVEIWYFANSAARELAHEMAIPLRDAGASVETVSGITAPFQGVHIDYLATTSPRGIIEAFGSADLPIEIGRVTDRDEDGFTFRIRIGDSPKL